MFFAKAERAGVGGLKARQTRGRRDDGILADRIAKGDQEAFAELYDRLAGTVMGLARAQLGDPTAEEIVQETFARVWRRASTYSAARGSLTAWVIRIGRNLAVDEMRRRGSRPQEQTLLAELIESFPDPAVQDPSEGVWQANMRAAVRQLCEQLPAEQRQVVGLAYLGGMSQSEIAQRLELPLGTVKSRTRAALYKLRAQMAKKGLLD